jgi:hypothetical protein
VPDEERAELLSGLKTNWEQLHKEYLGLSMITDSGPKKVRKNAVEQRLQQLETDIALIEKHPVIYVTQ